MLRTALLGGLTAVGLLLAAPSSLLGASGELRVTGDDVNLRAGPSEDAKVKGQVGQKDELVQLGREGDWYRVRVKATDEEGWIAAQLVEAAKEETADKAAAGAGDGDAVVFREKGEASVYDDKFQGKKTASGERFDQKKPQAAHPELPLGTQATVINPETGKKTEVEIVDRGPYAKGRDLDLSEGAAAAVGVTKEIKKEGDATVEIVVTKEQAQAAVEDADEVDKVEKQLKKARQSAAREGTPQPQTPVELEPPK